MNRPSPWLEIFFSIGRGLERLVWAAFTFLVLSTVTALASDDGERPLSIRLFDAHRPIQSLRILPPCQVVRDEAVLSMGSAVRAESKEGKIRLSSRSAGRPSIIAEAKSVFIRGIGAKPVMVLVAPMVLRRYRGAIILTSDRTGSLRVINRVKLRDYVNSVVSSETLSGTPREMLKAQAVLAQTLACRIGRLRDISDSTQDQSYLGAGAERAEVNAAVSSVWGKVLYCDHLPITVYFHSTCAGGTSNGAEYFQLKPASFPYLQAVPCRYCSRSPFWQPTRREIPLAEFGRQFGEAAPTIVKRDANNRPLEVRLTGGQLLTGYEFWIRLGQSFGWDKAPGTRYDVKESGHGTIVVESTGAGHGVGLCQWGASELARKGKTYREILSYYFKGCEVH
jgi:stage II sporulation protein D